MCNGKMKGGLGEWRLQRFIIGFLLKNIFCKKVFKLRWKDSSHTVLNRLQIELEINTFCSAEHRTRHQIIRPSPPPTSPAPS